MPRTGLLFVVFFATASALQCWRCENAGSNDDCLRNGSLDTCANGQDACQNDVTHRDGVLLMNKKCMKSSQCYSKSKLGFTPAWWQLQCNVTTEGTRSMTCKCCCYSDECNEGPLWCRRGPTVKQEATTCISGTVTADLFSPSKTTLYDDTNTETCEDGQTQCYLRTIGVVHSEWQAKTLVGGCFNEKQRTHLDIGESEMNKYIPLGAAVQSYQFDTCDGSNCFEYMPQDTRPKLTCSSGVTVTDEDTGSILLQTNTPKQCRLHSFCETYIVRQYNISSGEAHKYVYSGCGDPYEMKYKDLNLLSYLPSSTQDTEEDDQQCKKWGCMQLSLGLCNCPRGDVDVSQFVITSESSKDFCYEDMCNKGTDRTEEIEGEEEIFDTENFCPGGLVYSSCASDCPNICDEEPIEGECETCSPGCHCPDGKYITVEDKCVSAEECRAEERSRQRLL